MLSDFMETFSIRKVIETSDGMGGTIKTLDTATSFTAGISTNSTTEILLAQQTGMQSRYTIVVPITQSVRLRQNDMVVRQKTGRTYRITSNAEEMMTPDIAQVQFYQVSAEVTEE